jgi:hypothetical protein
MDNFEKLNELREGLESDSLSDSSETNDLLFQFIFGERDSTAHTHKPEKNEYLVSVTTHLKDPVNYQTTLTQLPIV